VWFFTILSIAGVILNIQKKRICFFVWLVTNSAWCVYDFHITAYAQSFLFLVYVVLAIWGLLKWKD